MIRIWGAYAVKFVIIVFGIGYLTVFAALVEIPKQLALLPVTFFR